MADITVTNNVDSFMQAADYAAMRTLLNVENGATADRPKYALFLGQSNMLGSGAKTNPDIATHPLVKIWVDNPSHANYRTWDVWDRSQTPSQIVYDNSNNIGSGCWSLSFAKKFAESTGREIRVIMAAEGGLSIVNWVDGDVGETMWTPLEAELDQMALTDDSIDLLGWCQGESDEGMAQATYEGHFNTIRTQLDARDEVHVESPMLIAEQFGGINPDKGQNPLWDSYYDNADGTNDIRNIVLAGSKYLPVHDTTTHFSAASLEIIGKVYAWAAYCGATPLRENRDGDNISVDGTPINYTAAEPDVQKHLEGIDTKLGTMGGGFGSSAQNFRDLNNADTRNFALNFALDPSKNKGRLVDAGWPWQVATTGTSSIARSASSYVVAKTGTTAGEWWQLSTSQMTDMDRQYPFGIGALLTLPNSGSFAGTEKFRVYLYRAQNAPTVGNDPSSYAVGFQVDSGGIKALTHDGTSLELEDLSLSIGSSEYPSARILVDTRNGGDVYWSVGSQTGSFEKTGFSRTLENDDYFCLVIEGTNGDQAAEFRINLRETINDYYTPIEL